MSSLIAGISSIGVGLMVVGVVAVRRAIGRRSERRAAFVVTKKDHETPLPTIYMNMTPTAHSATSSVYASNHHGFSVPGYLEYASDKDFKVMAPFALGGQSQIHELAPIHPQLLADSRGCPLLVKVIYQDLSKCSDKQQRIFMQELAVTHHFQSHPNVVRLYGWCRWPAALILRRYPFGDLNAFIRAHGPATQEMDYTKRNLIAILRQVSSALGDVHGRGFVHADVKSGNILLALDAKQEVHAALTDFGIARVLDPAATAAALDFKAANVAGMSVAYAAPEVILRLKHGPTAINSSNSKDEGKVWQRGDVYSLSVVISEMLNRRLWSVAHEKYLNLRSNATAATPFVGGLPATTTMPFRENPLYDPEHATMSRMKSDFYGFPTKARQT